MHPLTVSQLLSVWERGLGARPFERALSLLSESTPESSAAELAQVSIGRRDAQLLRLREWAFGSELPVVAACPRCRNSLETKLAVDDLCAPAEREESMEPSLTIGGYRIRCRAPNSEDVAACMGLDLHPSEPRAGPLGTPDLTESRQVLLARCVLEVTCSDEPVSVDRLPGSVTGALIERIAAMDQAEIRIDLTCPDCEYRWSELFDIVSFFWTEIDAWARRLLREVHILASAYGWSEPEILSLSPMRRQIYLAMAEA